MSSANSLNIIYLQPHGYLVSVLMGYTRFNNQIENSTQPLKKYCLFAKTIIIPRDYWFWCQIHFMCVKIAGYCSIVVNFITEKLEVLF